MLNREEVAQRLDSHERLFAAFTAITNGVIAEARSYASTPGYPVSQLSWLSEKSSQLTLLVGISELMDAMGKLPTVIQTEKVER